MNLRSFLFLILTAAICTSACSVYKSTGRKSFESKASSGVTASSTVGVRSQTEKDESSENETCWSQLASEPLWHVDAVSPLIVTKLNDDEIQVCLQAP